MSGDLSSRILQAAERQRGLKMDEALKAALVSLSGQSKSVKSATVEHVCKGLHSVTSPTGAGLITVWLGMAVENGANPRNSVEAVLQCFFKWSQGIVTAGSDKATDMKNDAEVMAGLQLLGQSVVSHLLRMPDLRHHLSHSREILTEVGRVEHLGSGVSRLSRLLSLRNGDLVVIDVNGRHGFRVRYRNIANCYHLFTLLQDALAEMRPGTPPIRPLLPELAPGKNEKRKLDTAWWHYGQGHTPWPDEMASVWGELSPDTIEYADGKQVLLLWPSIRNRNWDRDCFQPYLAELPPDVEILATLSASELDDWWERLNLPENAGNGAVAIEPWWKSWRRKRMTLQTDKQSGAAAE